MTESKASHLAALIKNVENIPGIEDCTKSKMLLRQWVTSINVSLILFLIGMTHGHTAILLQQLHPSDVNRTRLLRFENGEIFNKPTIYVDSLELQSWIASVMVLFMCPSCWILASCGEKIGRKPIFIISTTLCLISWIFMTFASNIIHILISRSMIGLNIGICAGLSSVYTAECTISKLRPIINTTQVVCLSMGILTCHVIGTWFHWRTTAMFVACSALITLIMNFYMPESPIWLLKRNKFEKAIRSWTFLRGIRDLDELKAMHVDKKQNNVSHNVIEEKGKNTKFISKKFLKPLGIILVLYIVSQFSGMGAVTFYCIQMITDIAGPHNSHIYTIILDTFRLISAIGLSIASKKYSTRALMLFSAFSVSLLLILLSISIFYNIWEPWLALILLFAYEVAVILGISPLPWIFCGELFPISHIELGISITTSFNYLLFFFIVKINPNLFVLFKPWGTFLFYGLITLAGSCILYIILPNTRNKSLGEIQLMLHSKKNISNQRS